MTGSPSDEGTPGFSFTRLIQKLAGPDGSRTGFKVAYFPVKVQGASGGWCRPVAFV